MATKKKTTKKKTSKKKASKKNAGGRPLIKIDWPKVEAMCKIQCTGEEIASILGFSYDTLERACKREQKASFADYIAQKRKGGKASLRRMQWKQAEAGNPTMLIWLGKNYLEQKDKHDFSSEDGTMTPETITRTVIDPKSDE